MTDYDTTHSTDSTHSSDTTAADEGSIIEGSC